MKEQDLIDLGFEKEFCCGNGGECHYYVYYLGIDLSLISNANDEATDGEWYVDIFEENSIRFTNIEDLTEFINIINRNKR